MNNYIIKTQGRSIIINNINNNNINLLLCCTHNNRLRDYFKNINDKDYTNKPFKNCVIIKCYKIDNKVKFTMIYEGFLNEDDKYIGWDIVSFNNYFNNKYFDINLPSNTEIYLIRHAVALHNKMNIVQKMFNFNIDSNLHTIGLEQAAKTGIFLKGYISQFYKNTSIKFTASHLIRTQQTIGIIMKMFQIKETIYIVPCSHELIYCADGNGDASLIQKIPVASNIPRCRNNNDTCSNLSIHNTIYDIDDININWDYYMKFYKLNKKCQDTNIILEIIKFS
jgi:phosphohistidine phosphatase SixA